MSYPDCRALCAELLDALLSESGPAMGQWSDLIARARAALAQPEAATPTDDELLRTFGGAKRDHCYDGPIDDWPRKAERAATIHALRVVLARWGGPAALQPKAIEPTDEELCEMYDEHCYIHDDAEDPHDWWGSMDKGEFVTAARAVLAHWSQPVAAPVPMSPTDEDLEAWRQAAIAQFNASSYDIPTSRTVALLAIEWCRKRDLSAIAPVPVSEEPWQRDGWCDQAGKCWFHSEGREFGDWYLLPAASMTNAETHCLPWWAIPLPRPTTNTP